MERTHKMNSSMQLTRAADYGVRVMVALAGLTEGGRVSLVGLTGATGAPESFLSKVMQSLARAGLVNSRRGIGGGFEMSATGRAASMRTVIEAIDGPIVLNICLSEGKSCKRRGTCPANPVWVRAQRAMLEVLDSAMIRELAKHEARMHGSECFGSSAGIQLNAHAPGGEPGSAGTVSNF